MRVRFVPDHVGEIRGAVDLLDSNAHVFATGFVHGIGNGPRLSFPPGAAFTIPGLDSIAALASDSVGNVYAAKTVAMGNGIEARIYRISPDGASTIVYRQPQPLLNLAIDGARNFYLTMGPGGGIRKVAPDGSITDFERTNSLGAVAIDGEGSAYAGHAGAIDRISPTGQVFPGLPLVGGENQTEIGLLGLVVSSAGNVLFDANAGRLSGGLSVRGKVYQSSSQGPPAGIVYDGGMAAGLGDLIQEPDGSLIAAAGGTVQTVSSTIPVMLLGADRATEASNGDIYTAAGGVLTRLSRSAAPGLSFVAQNRGESVAATLSITNTGNQPLTFDAQSGGITGPNASDFHIESTTCDGQTGLLPGATCTATLSFQSGHNGVESATLSATTNDPAYGNAPVRVPLEGVNP